MEEAKWLEMARRGFDAIVNVSIALAAEDGVDEYPDLEPDSMK